jgi:tetratricopeptide (TPR) repeat protein
MGAVTYPKTEVVEFVEQTLVPLQVQSDAPLAKNFNLQWTPTLIVLDTDGKEHHRAIGFLPPEDLIPMLMLGIGKCYFDSQQFEKAISTLEKLLDQYPKSDAAPEAVYLLGVARYKSTHDPKPLKQAYERLASQYAASEWTKRASPYRLL